MVLNQIIAGIGFLGGAIGFCFIAYARFTRKSSEGILFLPDERSAKIENRGLIIIIATVSVVVLLIGLAKLLGTQNSH